MGGGVSEIHRERIVPADVAMDTELSGAHPSAFSPHPSVELIVKNSDSLASGGWVIGSAVGAPGWSRSGIPHRRRYRYFQQDGAILPYLVNVYRRPLGGRILVIVSFLARYG